MQQALQHQRAGGSTLDDDLDLDHDDVAPGRATLAADMGDDHLEAAAARGTAGPGGRCRTST